MEKHDITRENIINHCNKYPKLTLQDLFKFLYQSSFGCEHALRSPEAVTDYIRREYAERRAAMPPCTIGDCITPLDGAYSRVDLGIISCGIAPETLAALFFLSAKHEKEAPAELVEKIRVTDGLIRDELLPFSEIEFVATADLWKNQGYPPIHHSDIFRVTYDPAYRVISNEFLLYLPLLCEIDRAMEAGRVLLAVEGGSASGKTTLAELLQRIYGCTVFHMDDFFLRHDRRTADRLAEPGGNVDRERFEAEILSPLSRGENVTYRKFDCRTQMLSSPITVIPTKLCVIEGAYSMHPALSGYYGLSVFLDISKEVQKARISRRNTPEAAFRFENEWIPLEEKYFAATHAKDRCTLAVGIEK